VYNLYGRLDLIEANDYGVGGSCRLISSSTFTGVELGMGAEEYLCM
jgi:hypothetical protein